MLHTVTHVQASPVVPGFTYLTGTELALMDIAYGGPINRPTYLSRFWTLPDNRTPLTRRITAIRAGVR